MLISTVFVVVLAASAFAQGNVPLDTASTTAAPPVTTTNGNPQTPPLVQACDGNTSITCLFHQFEHLTLGPRGYCANSTDDCAVLVCPVSAPYMCQSYGRCVTDFAYCSPCPASTPVRCEVDWSCQATAGACPQFPTNPEGALVKVTYSGITGVFLDEVGEATRGRTADYYSTLPLSFWQKKATYQGKMMEYRQIFRQFYYHDLQQLTTPPENLWQFEFGTPYRTKIGYHDFIAVNYNFTGYLLGTADTIARSSPDLVNVGGKFVDSWHMPVDESQIFQHTGYSCMDELDFPLNGIDSENTYVYYDDTCEFETQDNKSCHWSSFPEKSCLQALQSYGKQIITITWERVKWDDAIADAWRYPNPSTQPDYPQMLPVPGALNDNRIYWRYFKNTSCEVLPSENNCAHAPGWRKLWTFQSNSLNNGKKDLIVGIPTFAPWSETNLFVFSTCHNHYHFSHYIDYLLEEKNGINLPGKKAAFCIQSTWRFYNNEFTPFACNFGSCIYQGIASGWGDSYNAGLSCQWLDITDEQADTDLLVTTDNPINALCEGTLIINETTGDYVLTPLGTNNINGLPQFIPACKSGPIDEEAKKSTVSITIPPFGGTLVTTACSNHQFGPRRNCGFNFMMMKVACTPGELVHIRVVNTTSIATSVRFCPFSIVQQLPIACEYNYAYANVVVESKPVAAVFTCPTALDNQEVGGYYSVIAAPALETDPFVPPILRRIPI